MGKGTGIEISADDQYLVAQGTHYDIYKKLGAHLTEQDGKKVFSLQFGCPMPLLYTW